MTNEVQGLLDSLNEYQLRAANVGPGPAIVSGVPGSGKTRVLEARIARMVSEGYPAASILAMTFTNMAANELSTRLIALGVYGVKTGTIHSICKTLISLEQEGVDALSVCDGYRLEMALGGILGNLRRNRMIPQRGVSVSGIMDYVAMCKATGPCFTFGNPFGLNAEANKRHIKLVDAAWLEKMGLFSASQALKIYTDIDNRRAAMGLLTYDDMLLWAWSLLYSYEDIRKRWSSMYPVIIVDEAQDSNIIQWDIARMLAGCSSLLDANPEEISTSVNLMVAGEASQCQPAGEQVSIGPGESTPIEQLRTDTTVVSWNRQTQKTVASRGIKVSERAYHGPLIKVCVQAQDELRSTRATSNHKFLCRWADKTSRVCVTYIMYRRDLGYRVGWCQLFSHSNSRKNCFHVAQRARLEKADAVWILRLHEDRANASIYESIVAALYGLPTITFEPMKAAKHFTTASIPAVFTALAPVIFNRGQECLKAHGRDHQLPFWPWPNKPPGTYGRSTYFEVFATNILPNIMCVPLPEGRNSWGKIVSIEREEYVGTVYSLDVDKDHSYVVNGIVTLNSIYSWRNAVPEAFVDFAKEEGVGVYPIPLNYRSVPEICAVATKLVEDEEWHITGEVRPADGAECTVEGMKKTFHVAEYAQAFIEAREVVQKAVTIGQEEGELKNVVVMSRLSMFLHIAEIECLRHKIPYVKRASGSFLDSREVLDILAYLRVAAGYDPLGKNLLRCIKAPFKYIGKPSLEQAASQHAVTGCGVLTALLEQPRLSIKQRRSLKEMEEVIRGTQALVLGGAKPADVVSSVIEETRYLDYLRETRSDAAADSTKVGILLELEWLASLFETTVEFLSYVDQLHESLRLQRKLLKKDDVGQGDYLVLTTIHRAKALEWDHVFIGDVVAGRFPWNLGHSFGEELRLMYVAVTRARKSIHLSCSKAEGDADSSLLARVKKACTSITATCKDRENTVS